MYAVAGSFGFPPIFEAVTEAQRRRRRLAWGLAVSILFHLTLVALLWTHRAELRQMRLTDDLPVTVMPAPGIFDPGPMEDAEAAAGGGGAAPPPAAAAREPQPLRPPFVAPFAPAPESTAIEPSPVTSDVQRDLGPLGGTGRGDGAGSGLGAGDGGGRGDGLGPGQGSGPGKGLGTGDGAGWNPRWIRQPNGREGGWFYSSGSGVDGAGWAVIRCTITASGRARRCFWLEQSAPGFGPASVDASRYFRITPKVVDGRAVAADLDIRLEFYKQ